MQKSSRLFGLIALGGALALAACSSAPDASPVAPTATSVSNGSGTVTSSGNGSGPAPGSGSGTCTNDCDGTGQGPGPGDGTGSGYGPGPGPSDGFCGNACVGPVGPDPADIVALLERALQEEYNAELLYRHVLAIFGPDTAPFALIAEAEARHVAALQLLFTRRSLAPPPWSPRSLPAFVTIPEACAEGVTAEVADAAFYAPYLERTDLPQDVRNVFENLQAASLDNHLPAFERCR
jgi:hypothetical protein